MNISIYGAGYVGLVTAVCLAELGHTVCCVDIDTEKITRLEANEPTFYEQGLTPLLKKQLRLGRLRLTALLAEAYQFGAVHMICVGTPPRVDQATFDTSGVYACCLAIAKARANDSQSTQTQLENTQTALDIASTSMHNRHDTTPQTLIVIKSTVPFGTAQALQIACADFPVMIASNPEFLREGRAIADFMTPDRIVIGASELEAIECLRTLYQPLIQKGYPFLVMSSQSAELTKLAANAFLATKISFINEISQIADVAKANVDDIAQALGCDPRIGPDFLQAGCGYGGSCLPKDIRALDDLARQAGVQPKLLPAAMTINQQQPHQLLNKLKAVLREPLHGRVIALWGLAFKPNTDDIRQACSTVLMEALWEAGAIVQAYDPMAMDAIRRRYPVESRLRLMRTPMEAVFGANALILCTEWSEFHHPDFAAIHAALRTPVLIDGRNLYDPAYVLSFGLRYDSVGRPHAVGYADAAQGDETTQAMAQQQGQKLARQGVSS